MVVCMECIIVEYVKNRHNSCPKQLRYIVYIASPTKISSCMVQCAKPSTIDGKRSANGIAPKNSSNSTSSSNIEMRKKENDYDSDDDPDFEHSKDTTARVNPLTRDIESSEQRNDSNFKDKETKDVSFDDMPFGWPKVASSIDRIARTAITISFILFVGIKCSIMI